MRRTRQRLRRRTPRICKASSVGLRNRRRRLALRRHRLLPWLRRKKSLLLRTVEATPPRRSLTRVHRLLTRMRIPFAVGFGTNMTLGRSRIKFDDCTPSGLEPEVKIKIKVKGSGQECPLHTKSSTLNHRGTVERSGDGLSCGTTACLGSLTEYLTRQYRARKPSFHPIFLPSS